MCDKGSIREVTEIHVVPSQAAGVPIGDIKPRQAFVVNDHGRWNFGRVYYAIRANSYPDIGTGDMMYVSLSPTSGCDSAYGPGAFLGVRCRVVDISLTVFADGGSNGPSL